MTGIEAVSNGVPAFKSPESRNAATTMLWMSGILGTLFVGIVALFFAYPSGGGSYIVASENLGRIPGLIAASALLIDYVLTVAVSVASGIAALVSAVPAMADAIVPLGIVFVAVLAIGNLRGVRESGALFAAPTYLFVVSLLALIAIGVVRVAIRMIRPRPGFRARPCRELKRLACCSS